MSVGGKVRGFHCASPRPASRILKRPTLFTSFRRILGRGASVLLRAKPNHWTLDRLFRLPKSTQMPDGADSERMIPEAFHVAKFGAGAYFISGNLTLADH